MQTKDWFVLKSKAEQAGYSKKNFPGLSTSWRRGVPIMVGALLLGAGAVDAASLDKAIEDAISGRLNCAGVAPGSPLAAVCGGGGSSSGGAAAAAQTTPGVVQERLLKARGEGEGMADSVSELLPGLSVFLSGEYESLDKDRTPFEGGYDSDIQRFTLGSDYQFTDKVMAGLAFTYYNHDGDFDNFGGDFDNDSYGVTFFASILPIDQVFVQVNAGYAAKDYDRTRAVSFSALSGLANADYEGDEYSAGILAGYDYTVGNLSIGPRLGLDYIRTEFDSYTETGSTGLELSFADADQTSLQSRLGLASSLAFSTGFGVLLPQAGVNWVHEFENDQRSEAFSFKDDLNSVAFLYENEGPDRDFFEFTLGVSAVLPHGWLPFVQFRAIAGHEYLDSYAGTIGLRKEF
ncbi:autotransporter outer membrane beta-barrel domain-containing protein [Desulfopila sp. IMCC35006]|uniref:autotransporter outer membrane beta-barrel domain-containing protein n=1 Tax=Desulfopila sp. IMCC35006 TaxID=2569542 RepID=UPI0010AC29BA|nr:autotransporter outer membrane beta-barrel domain-containing protein [Desulfopila sp. IMCC35006]TKB25221.1 autotransporter outer membrane beta-barrel domain-containing protein [Desulfopila sp. IMCC35006]